MPSYLKPSHRKKLVLTGLALATISTATAAIIQHQAAQAPAIFASDNPTASYSQNSTGTVTKTADGLEWSRCLVGQTLQNNACVGEPTAFATWQDALAALTPSQKAQGWRVANIKELMRITDSTFATPATNTQVFRFAQQLKFADSDSYPHESRAPTSSYIWSSSPVAHRTATVGSSYQSLTEAESIEATDKNRLAAEKVYALDLAYGKPVTVYRDGKSRGEKEASVYFKPDPDNVEKARYVLLVRTVG